MKTFHKWGIAPFTKVSSFFSMTVQMGKPTPSITVPQTTLSRPQAVSFSTKNRYFARSRPAWWLPQPWRRSFWVKLKF
jgi:hypothetical protein